MKPKGLGKPVIGERGTKLGVYGDFGTGKTELLMTATEVGHLLLVDAEGRSQYYDPSKGNGFEVIYTKNIKEALELLGYAEELHDKGENVIFGLDGFSTIWFEQQQVAEAAGTTSRGTARFDSWALAKKPLKLFYDKMFETPVDCIVTMRSKPKYGTKQENYEAKGFDAPDTERGINYALDLVVEMHKDDLVPGTKLTPDNFWAVVVKTSGPRDSNPLPIGTMVRDATFSKLHSLRLKGTRFKISGLDMNLEMVIANVLSPTDLVEWTNSLGYGITFDNVKPQLVAQFGKYKPELQEQYIRAIWEIYETLKANGNSNGE